MTETPSEVLTPRLLLVDDEPGLRTAVQAYLEDEGFDVTTAEDGEEGFSKAQQMLPDVVISDVMMPRLDGYGLLRNSRGRAFGWNAGDFSHCQRDDGGSHAGLSRRRG